MLGLEPLYLACEGRMVIMAPKAEAEKIVEVLHKCPYSQNAAIIGEVTAEQPGKVVMTTEIGTQALLPQYAIVVHSHWSHPLRFRSLLLQEGSYNHDVPHLRSQ